MKVKVFAIVFVLLGVVVVRSSRAASPDPQLKASLYSATLVQAMDQCGSAVTNVGGVGGCAPSNTSTDGTHLSAGRVQIKNRAGRAQVTTQLRSRTATPPGALANKTVHTVIILRVTSTVGTPVTWVDQTLDCPNILVPAQGDVMQRVALTDCGLAPALADNTTNKEVVSVQVVDSGSGKPIAVPGVRRKQ